MSQASFEPSIPALEWPKNYALDRVASGIGQFFVLLIVIVRERRCWYWGKPYLIIMHGINNVQGDKRITVHLMITVLKHAKIPTKLII
jgi:hypothetical protein